MTKIKDFFYRLAYALPFGLKGADKEIMGNSSTKESGTNIQQEVNDERVGRHLLKGEVTQEVEELRYRTYKVSNDSENFQYAGNGIAVKKEEALEENKKKIRFSQENSIICASILDEFKHMNDYGVDNYKLEVSYTEMVRFKIEQFATLIDVYINEDERIIETKLHFSKVPNPYNAKSMPFINELKKIKNLNGEYAISRNEIISSFSAISFYTYKATNEEDFVTYSFLMPKFREIIENDFEYVLIFDWRDYSRLPLNLEQKYYSKEMDEKYKNKEKKNVSVAINNTERKRYCSICGKEVSVYDGDIQEYDNGVVLCQECMLKTLNK